MLECKLVFVVVFVFSFAVLPAINIKIHKTNHSIDQFEHKELNAKKKMNVQNKREHCMLCQPMLISRKLCI